MSKVTNKSQSHAMKTYCALATIIAALTKALRKAYSDDNLPFYPSFPVSINSWLVNYAKFNSSRLAPVLHYTKDANILKEYNSNIITHKWHYIFMQIPSQTLTVCSKHLFSSSHTFIITFTFNETSPSHDKSVFEVSSVSTAPPQMAFLCSTHIPLENSTE